MKSIKKQLILGVLTVVMLLPIRAQMVWKQVEAGVWKGVIGTPEDYSLLDASAVVPLKEGFTRLPEVSLPDLADEIIGSIQDGRTNLRIPLQKNEQLYGFGLNFQTVHQRGKILNLHVDHYGGKDNGRTHAPVPFYVSSLGYGVLLILHVILQYMLAVAHVRTVLMLQLQKTVTRIRHGLPIHIRMPFLFLYRLPVLKFIFLQVLLLWM